MRGDQARFHVAGMTGGVTQTGDPAHVVNFMRFIAMELREIMAQLGFKTINEMVGQVDRLKMRSAVNHWKANGLDLSKILYTIPMGPDVGRYHTQDQNHGLNLFDSF